MDIGILPEFRNPTQWAVPIEQVYRDVLRPAASRAPVPAQQGSGEPSCW